jgi:hypothetical protein
MIQLVWDYVQSFWEKVGLIFATAPELFTVYNFCENDTDIRWLSGVR